VHLTIRLSGYIGSLTLTCKPDNLLADNPTEPASLTDALSGVTATVWCIVQCDPTMTLLSEQLRLTL